MSDDRAYFIQDTVLDTDGGFIPCIAVRGEQGFHKTDWNWGTDREIAEQIAEEKNAAMGVSPKDAIMIVMSTMRFSPPWS